MDESLPSRVLAVMAHPDDVDFGAAGTIARWTAAGVDVHYVIVTSGDAGGSADDDTPREQMPVIREAEQRAAAAAVGVADVTFLRYPDGKLTPSMDVRRDISRHIRRLTPDLVLCQSPERNYDRLPASHPDHLAAGEATLCAVYPDARNPYAHPELLADEGLAAHSVPTVWMMAAPQSNHYVDITETFDAKIAALRSHVSQTSGRENLAEMIRGWATMTAAAGGLPEGRLAESFRAITVP
jgi:LmbE family N-acetylglucosaminyl deacetylase